MRAIRTNRHHSISCDRFASSWEHMSIFGKIRDTAPRYDTASFAIYFRADYATYVYRTINNTKISLALTLMNNDYTMILPPFRYSTINNINSNNT